MRQRAKEVNPSSGVDAKAVKTCLEKQTHFLTEVQMPLGVSANGLPERRLLSILVVRLGGFVFGAGFPAAVDPEVLAGIGADEVFDGARVTLRDVALRIILLLPLLGP